MSVTNVNDNLFKHPAKNNGSRPFVIVGNMNHAKAFDHCQISTIMITDDMDHRKIRNLIITASTMATVYVAVSENYPHLSDIGEALYLEGLPVAMINTDNIKSADNQSFVKRFNLEASKSKTVLEQRIDELPDSLIKAEPLVQKIAAVILKMKQPVQKHYTDIIAKKIGSKPKIVEDIIAEANQKQSSLVIEDEMYDPIVLGHSKDFGRDPQLLKKRIDAINRAGVCAERLNIAIIFSTLDSRLLLDINGLPGQSVLALKIAGHAGCGKSFTLMTTLQAYPAHGYYMFTSASDNALFYLEGGIKHRCLIAAEAFQFAGTKASDNDFVYALRSLISEGRISRFVTAKNENGDNASDNKVLEGPASFITTTIESGLEHQLEDRLITIHPDESVEQTKRIISASAEKVSGQKHGLNVTTELSGWRAFHSSLKPVGVVIPYATDIANYFNGDTEPAVNTRRAFNKLLNIIKAVCCAYQHQRERDEHGNIVATIPDYFMSLQIIKDAFAENIGCLPKDAQIRIDFIENMKIVKADNIVSHFKITRKAAYNWLDKYVENGYLIHVDEKGKAIVDPVGIKGEKYLNRLCYTLSKSIVKSPDQAGLPTAFELTKDPAWNEGGELYKLYDLELDRK